MGNLFGQAAGQQQGGAGWTSTILRWAMMYFAINMFMSKWRGDPTPKPQTDSEGNPIAIPISQRPHSPLWKSDMRYNLRIYLSEQPDLFSVIDANNAEESLIFNKFLTLSCNDVAFVEKDKNISIPDTLQNNGSYYAHIIMSQFGYPHDPEDEDYDHTRVLFRTHSLISYKANPSNENQIIGFWKSQLTLRPLCDWTSYKSGAIPPQIFEHFTIDIESNKYWPILYMDDFWLSDQQFIFLDENTQIVPLKISVSPIKKWKFMLQTQMQKQYEQQANPLSMAWNMIQTLLQTAVGAFTR